MNTNALNWHPQFKVYRLGDDILLYGEQQQLLLPKLQFPMLNKIDGVSSTDEILKHIRHPGMGAAFVYYTNQLIKQGLLTQSRAELGEYKNGYVAKPDSSLINERYQVLLLSSCSAEYKAQWLTVLNTVIQTMRQKLAKQPVPAFILVDDFFDPAIGSLSQGLDYFILIKITGQLLWFSPVFASDRHFELARLQDQLLANQPIRKMLHSRFADEQHSHLYTEVNLKDQLPALSEMLVQHLLKFADQLSQINVLQQQLSQHPVNIGYQAQDMAEQMRAPVILQDCAVEYNEDGGSRHISPQQTVARLRALVSPVTGVIAYMDELASTEGHPVKIYRSGFFKTPAYHPQWQSRSSLDNASFVQTCLGKGVSPIQSQASALCEAVERYAALYQGDEPSRLSCQSDLPGRSYNYQQLVPYSEAQYQQFADPSRQESNLKQAAMPYQNNEIPWLPGWSLSHQEAVYLPLTCCLSNTPFAAEQFGRWHSNGCAAGNTLEEAILQALFELIERDAIAIWWYNQVSRPGFDIESIDKQYLEPLKTTLAANHDFWILDLTTDVAAPVMAAIGKNKQNGGYCLGFGCHLQPTLAAQRALTELCQLIPIREQNDAPFDFDAIVEGDYLHPAETANKVAAFIETGMDIKQDILSIVGQLDHLGFETVAVNYSRAHLPIKTAKVFVPGLCHIWPQLANQRLYQTPVSLGWLAQARTEGSVHGQDLYI